MEKKLMLKLEICKKGKLSEFENVLEGLIDSILESDCLISCCDICETSSIEQFKNGNFKSMIKIGFKNSRDKPVHIIWEILHEFGHHLSGLPNGKEKSYERELQAWDFGLLELKKYAELLVLEDDYMEYKKSCLSSYV